MTVVADNLEQVSIDAGRLLGSLLERAPAVTVLATSRVRLSCRGERVLTVPPLDTGAARVPTGGAALVEIPAAVEMFVSRVNSAFPDVRLDDQLDDVRELCRTLGGLPLAIELAAAQARTMTPRQYRARIQALLTSNAPKGSAGETLRASIEASLRLVPTLARERFPLLAVFSGGFTLEAVEAVCDDFGDATDPAVWLADLVDASLVYPVESPAGRRFMLLEPLRIAAAR